MTHTQWSPKMTVGNAVIDAAHEALFDEMQRLLSGADAELDVGLLCLSDKLECDFREEESLMEALDFSGIRNHRAEHARVLSALHHVAPDDVVAAREVLQLMSLWFPVHVTTMDAQLAAALVVALLSLRIRLALPVGVAGGGATGTRRRGTSPDGRYHAGRRPGRLAAAINKHVARYACAN